MRNRDQMKSAIMTWLSRIGITFLIGMPAAAHADDRCGTYPPKVAHSVYGGWGDCRLREAGQGPLWHGLRQGLRQQVRFTFNDGHGRYTKVIVLEERDKGGGTLTSFTIMRGAGSAEVTSRRTRRLTDGHFTILNSLAEQSGIWSSPIGSWDEGGDSDEIFLHCETLDMERVTSAGYRVSTASISCNQPTKLMPLVTYVTRLAGLKPSVGGLVF